ncbi:MAG: polyprenyl diphosphate synthase [Rikenellaceae bacterium]
MSDNKRVPKHVAIIMDGNGRWAKLQGKERFEGHIQGVESVRTSIKAAVEFGVKYLTLYTFSTENWGRPTEEVEALMELFCKCVASETPSLIEQGVRVRIIGDKGRFSQEVLASLERIEADTAKQGRLELLLALNYSSRDELRRGILSIAQRVEAGEIAAADVDENLICASLDTAGVPDPDLIVRSGGECRLSNFLMWQAAYSELYFPEVLWPDFDREQFIKALEAFASRDRRYGLVKVEA